ncbi:hypothetical protein BSKO_05432 [Bryopsis sp. KO-2023]|nr:hypothetical protein BSKO_05432 [Bryopsis sp. KO-2023]
MCKPADLKLTPPQQIQQSKAGREVLGEISCGVAGALEQVSLARIPALDSWLSSCRNFGARYPDVH